jgi:hypothetical protein
MSVKALGPAAARLNEVQQSYSRVLVKELEQSYPIRCAEGLESLFLLPQD